MINVATSYVQGPHLDAIFPRAAQAEDNREIFLYLDDLLTHECQVPWHQPCPDCEALDRILRVVKSQIFSGPIYPDITLRARQEAS